MNKVQKFFLVLAQALVASMGPSRADIRYVAQNGQTPEWPFTNGWSSAADNIQDAVDAADAGDTVLVGPGVYDRGGVPNYPSGTALTNRVAVYKAITVRSANDDPAATVIKGQWNSATNALGPAAVRCVYLAAGASLIGFTVTNGATTLTGAGSRTGDVAGGVCSPSVDNLVSNCWILGNTAWGEGGERATAPSATASSSATRRRPPTEARCAKHASIPAPSSATPPTTAAGPRAARSPTV